MKVNQSLSPFLMENNDDGRLVCTLRNFCDAVGVRILSRVLIDATFSAGAQGNADAPTEAGNWALAVGQCFTAGEENGCLRVMNPFSNCEDPPNRCICTSGVLLATEGNQILGNGSSSMAEVVRFNFAHLHWCIPKFPWVTGFILEGLLYMECQCQSPKWQPHSTMSSF